MDPETQRALLEYLYSMGYLGPQSFQTGGGVVPMGPDGGPTSEQKRGIDFAQDYNSYLADPMLGALAGGQGFTAAAFQPTIDRKEVDLPGRRMLQAGLSGNPGTMNNIIATEIANGGDQASAYAIIANILNGTPTTPEEEQIQQTLIGSIPPMMMRDDVSGSLVSQGPDLDKVWGMAGDMYNAYISDPVADEYSPDGMRGYNVTETSSELAQKFSELGLPTPYEQYDIYQMLGPDHQGQRDLTTEMLGKMQSSAVMSSPSQQRAMAEVIAPQRSGPDVVMEDVPPSAAVAQTGGDGAYTGNLDTSLAAPGMGFLAPNYDNPSLPTYGYTGQPSGGPSSDAAIHTDAPQQRVAAIPAIGQSLSGGAVSGAKKRADRRAAAQRAPREQKPSPTMAAYRDYFNQASKTYNDDYWQTYWQVRAAKDQGRTPLSDVLSARRAQGLVGGVPIGWG